MPGCLVDTNIWLAAVFDSHPFHRRARRHLEQASTLEPAVMCRAIQQSFLRLASTPTLLNAYGATGLTNRDALEMLNGLMALPQVVEIAEPPGTFALWRRIAAYGTASPKVWMDAYLAAFAICGELRMASLDKDFRNFESHGLRLDALDDREDPTTTH